jgi:NAD(P)-dependent dehydrogenase (short-subunit alcohol dehydrogenase family)
MISRRIVRDDTIDLLVNNAGAYFERWGQDSVGSIRYEDWEETFRVNTLGPMRVTEALLPHLNRGERPLVLAITSHMGSIADIDAPRDYADRPSKGAPPQPSAPRRACVACPISSIATHRPLFGGFFGYDGTRMS